MIIKWNKGAVDSLLEIIEFLNDNDFEDYAERLKTNLLIIISNLPKTFDLCRPDKYKNNNDGSFKAFEYENYRVSFRVKDGEIRILRIRHTKRRPKQH
jgi:plasmid stabilization system protein ParE